MRCLRTIATLILVALPTGCALETSPRRPAPQETARSSTSRPLDARQTERVQRIVMPLLRATDNPRRLNEIRVRVLDDPNINAANAGGGEFLVNLLAGNSPNSVDRSTTAEKQAYQEDRRENLGG